METKRNGHVSMSIRVDTELYNRIKTASEDDNRSLNYTVCLALKSYLKQTRLQDAICKLHVSAKSSAK